MPTGYSRDKPGQVEVSPMPIILELTGVAEVAEILGWSSSKVSVYARRGLLPEPVARLRCGLIWLRSDIQRYADAPRTHRTHVQANMDRWKRGGTGLDPDLR